MRNITEFFSNKLLDENLADVQVALYTDDGEVKADSYKRMDISFSQAKDKEIVTDKDVLFPVAQETWGIITRIVIVDKEGNELLIGKPDVEILVKRANQYKIPKGYAIVRID